MEVHTAVSFARWNKTQLNPSSLLQLYYWTWQHFKSQNSWFRNQKKPNKIWKNTQHMKSFFFVTSKACSLFCLLHPHELCWNTERLTCTEWTASHKNIRAPLTTEKMLVFKKTDYPNLLPRKVHFVISKYISSCPHPTS